MVAIQDFLNKKADKKTLQDIDARELISNLKKIDVDLELEGGELDLTGYEALHRINIDGDFLQTPLTKVTLPASLPKLFELQLPNNELTSIDFLTKLTNSNLRMLNLGYNKIKKTNLEFLKPFTKLQYLFLGNYYNSEIMDDFIHNKVSIFSLSEKRVDGKVYNNFYGSLESIKDCSQLEKLCIANTDIDSGLEYLPLSLVEINERAIRTRDVVSDDYKFESLEQYLAMRNIIDVQPLREGAKCKTIWEDLKKHDYNIRKWQKENIELVRIAQPSLFSNIFTKDKYK